MTLFAVPFAAAKTAGPIIIGTNPKFSSISGVGFSRKALRSLAVCAAIVRYSL